MGFQRIAISTGGGDAPGLNAVIRAVVVTADHLGWEVVGIRQGYKGLSQEGGVMRLTREAVRGITHLGGTILGTTNKGNPFEYPVETDKGTVLTDISDTIVSKLRALDIDALITVGGDGSLGIGYKLFRKGVPVVGVPKTIDNDLEYTVVTFGFDTAVRTATEALDKLHTTAEAHERVMVVEVMGRYAGWIALNSGLAGTADVILIPEIPFDIEKVCGKVRARYAAGRPFAVVVVAEGATPMGGGLTAHGAREPGRDLHLGGVAEKVAHAIQERTGRECRTVVLGHLQRGGGPTSFDRLIALRFGAAAVRLVREGKFGHMVALDPPTVMAVPLELVVQRNKFVPSDCDTMVTARELGVCFGD